MNVGTDLESLYMSDSSTVFGVIYIHSFDIFYPDKTWTDFVVVLLASWAHEIRSLENSDTKSVELHFMDGPYMIELTRLEGSEVRARFISRGQKGSTVKHEQIVNVQTFRESLKQTLQDVIKKCQKEGWQGKDQLGLEKVLKTLN